jgi:hypothetical protein
MPELAPVTNAVVPARRSGPFMPMATSMFHLS